MLESLESASFLGLHQHLTPGSRGNGRNTTATQTPELVLVPGNWVCRWESLCGLHSPLYANCHCPKSCKWLPDVVCVLVGSRGGKLPARYAFYNALQRLAGSDIHCELGVAGSQERSKLVHP